MLKQLILSQILSTSTFKYPEIKEFKNLYNLSEIFTVSEGIIESERIDWIYENVFVCKTIYNNISKLTTEYNFHDKLLLLKLPNSFKWLDNLETYRPFYLQGRSRIMYINPLKVLDFRNKYKTALYENTVIKINESLYKFRQYLRSKDLIKVTTHEFFDDDAFEHKEKNWPLISVIRLQKVQMLVPLLFYSEKLQKTSGVLYYIQNVTIFYFCQ